MCAWMPLLLLAAPPWPAPEPPLDSTGFGLGIQRSLTLLADSTAEHRNTVRVLFYGQSITEQAWARQVADDLRARFPHANLVIENRAIGGFAAQMLVKTAESDLYPFYPDLMIFHVYGDHRRYEDIIRRTRSRTTAEVLMATDHITRDEELDEPTDPAGLTPAQWSAWMNHAFLPATAARYGCELADLRVEWKRYLRAHGLKAADLLRDGVHLNEHGCFLMAELIKPHLRHLTERSARPWAAMVRDVEPVWRDGRLRLEFEGNRLDLIAAPGPAPELPAEVLIDGEPPSRLPGVHAFGRATAYPGVPWPCVMQVRSNTPRIVEEWTLEVLEHDDACERIRFRAVGSVTGNDGEGLSTEPFVSRSGRVVIDPDDWSMARSREYTNRPLPEGFRIVWRCMPQYTDRYEAPAVTDTTIETATTLAQGMPNGPHVLELVATGGVPPVAAVRVYQPPYAETDGADE